jgi:hypothetical protein
VTFRHSRFAKPSKKNKRLLLQAITLRWRKETRGAPYSTLRNRYAKAFQIPDTLYNYDLSYGLPYHEVIIEQDKNGFEVVKNKCSILDANEKSRRLGCIEIGETESGHLFTFKYSSYCGKPVRYDKFYNPLVEKAFELLPNEYGRIVYNGRHSLLDTGEWYYEIHILNALHTELTNSDLLTAQTPVKEYKQLEILF